MTSLLSGREKPHRQVLYRYTPAFSKNVLFRFRELLTFLGKPFIL